MPTEDYTDNTAVEPQIIRRRRTIRPANIHYCKFNQYYDQEEGRCLGVPGGGKVLHIENRQSCGINVLKPHCKSSLYYHICKRDKSILAQCANRQIFDNRLQRCVYYDLSKLTPSIIPPDDYIYDHIIMPRCTRYGRFPVPGHCSMFYICDTNGHRLHQSIFKCPQNTGYQVDRGVCNIMADCENDNSVDTTFCVPDAPGENVESSHFDEAINGNVKEISEILEESKANTDDPIVEKEKNVNFKNFDDIITTTPVNTIGPLSENNYNDNDNDMEVVSSNASSLNPIKEDSISEGSDEKIMYSQTPNQLETVQKASDGGQNEEDGSSLLNLRITSPLTTEFDDTSHSITEQYRNNEDSIISSSNLNTDSVHLYSAPTINNISELPPIKDVSLNEDEKMQDAITEQNRSNEDSTMTPSNFDTDSVNQYTPSIVSNVAESSPISETPKIDEEMQDEATEYGNNKNSIVTPSNFNIDSIDKNPSPTISNVLESSPISDVSPNIEEIHSKQHRNNEDSTMTPSNFNTDSVDQYTPPIVSNVAESSPISETPSKIDEEMQDEATKYGNNEDSIVTPSNFNTDSIDKYLSPTISNVPESSPINETPSKIDEEMQDESTEYGNNEDSIVTPSNFNTDSIDKYPAPTISNVPESSPINDVSSNIDEEIQDVIPKQYGNNEDSTMRPSNFNTDSVDQYTPPIVSNVAESSPISETPSKINEEMQDEATEYRNNEDSIVTPSNFNTDSIDKYLSPTISNVPESSPNNETPSKIDEEMQDEATEYGNNGDSIVTPSNFNTDSIDKYPAPTINNVPESSPINDVSPNIDEEIQDAIPKQYGNNEDSTITPSNFNTDSIDQYTSPIVSNVAKSSPISETPSKIDEEMQDEATEYGNNEDSIVTPSNFNTDSIDKYLAPTISNVPESSPINDVSPNIDEEIQDAIPKQYGNNEDSTMTPSNFNTDSVDQYTSPIVSNVAESSPISEMPSKIDEEMQDEATEYGNNEDSIVTPSNFNTDSIDKYLAPTISNVSVSSPINDVSPNIDEEIQEAIPKQYGNNEDSTMTPSNFNTDSVDQYTSPIVSNVAESSPISETPSKIDEEMQDEATEYGNNYVAESSPISDVPSNKDEKMQDAITEEYKDNEDSIMTPLTLNTDTVDQYPALTVSNTAESSPISSTSAKIDEEMQDASTEQSRNNEDSTLIPSNLNSDLVDLYSAPTLNNMSESSPISDVSPNLDEKMKDAITEEKGNNEDSIMTPTNFNTD
ncbi:PREDICTED: protein PF14_0175-like [Atta colombica]|uniref:protein PF14_0175-like n=1 Tax=Atta colombica TaxID=520822 RepID=UPI00084C2FCB|nr:PREDICTED: protein PF14_0175-like [Atta colombica]